MSTDLSFPDFSEALKAYFMGDKPTALRALTQLSLQHPDNASVHIMLGNVRYSLGELDDALKCFRKASELEPEYGHALYRLGVCSFRAGLLDDAKEAFRRNLELDGQSHAMSNYWIGLIDYFLGRDDEALGAFAELKRLSPQSNFANFFMAQLLVKHNRHQEAIDLLNELVARTPSFVEAHYLMGQAYRGLYRIFEAMQCFRTALALAPDDQRIRAELDMLVEVPAP